MKVGIQKGFESKEKEKTVCRKKPKITRKGLLNQVRKKRGLRKKKRN